MNGTYLLILGSGQLGNMLAESCQQLGIPATQFALDKTQDSLLFLQKIKAEQPNLNVKAIIESETVPLSTLQNLQDHGVKICPSIETFSQWRNKAKQKKTFKDLNLPTSPFYTFQELQPFNLKDLNQNNYLQPISNLFISTLNKALEIWPQGFILKIGEGGYDGKGVWKVDSQSNHATLVRELFKTLRWQEAAHFWSSLYIEEFCPFECELALQAFRTENNELFFYPLVLSEQKNSICNVVQYEQHNKWSQWAKDAQNCARVLATHYSYQGLFAIEFFLHPQKGLWINEIAPRVHNSGHHTLNTFNCSQFDAHIQAVCNFPFSAPLSIALAAFMFNLIGQSNLSVEKSEELAMELNCFDWPPNFHFYWYDKTPICIGRKMGHLNVVLNNFDAGQSLPELRKQAENLMERLWFQKQK